MSDLKERISNEKRCDGCKHFSLYENTNHGYCKILESIPCIPKWLVEATEDGGNLMYVFEGSDCPAFAPAPAVSEPTQEGREVCEWTVSKWRRYVVIDEDTNYKTGYYETGCGSSFNNGGHENEYDPMKNDYCPHCGKRIAMKNEGGTNAEG